MVSTILNRLTPDEYDGLFAGSDAVVRGLCAVANGGNYAALRKTGGTVALGTYKGVRVKGRYVKQGAAR